MLIGQDADNILCCLVKVGGVGEFGEVKVLWGELNFFCVPIRRSDWDVEVVTAVMVVGRTNIPTVDSMC